MYIFLYLLYWNCIYMVEAIIISTVVVKGLIHTNCVNVCGPVYVWLICHIMCVCCTGVTF